MCTVVGTYLHNPLDPHARLSQDANNVLAALLRLVRDATLDQVTLCVCWDLAGNEDLRAGDDGLGLFGASVRLLFQCCAIVEWER
jgi:hypothetical protein